MGQLVGPAGRVYSLEFLPEIARTAAETLQTLGIANVSIITGDGGDGWAAGAPYDRAIFTAGTYDLPRAFYDQLKEGGLLLAVIKLEGGGDCLFLLRKTEHHFESADSMLCAFVQLQGKHQMPGLEPATLESLPGWAELQKQEVSRTRFWWGGRGPESFVWRTQGIRFFLAITEPCFRAFKAEKTAGRPHEDYFFGLWDQDRQSLALVRDDYLISHGNASAREQLLARVRQWTHLGMPGAASFRLQVHPHDDPVAARENQWIVKRRDSTFLWSLER
jgi:hypothetical protein